MVPALVASISSKISKIRNGCTRSRSFLKRRRTVVLSPRSGTTMTHKVMTFDVPDGRGSTRRHACFFRNKLAVNGIKYVGSGVAGMVCVLTLDNAPPVAAKELHIPLDSCQNTWQTDCTTSIQELRCLMELSASGGHANVVKFLGTDAYRHNTEGHDWARVYLYMEYVDGRNLYETMSDPIQRYNFTAHRVRDVTLQVLQGLDFIHSHGIVHGDIKGSNIILESRTSDGGAWNAKICDCGLCAPASMACLDAGGHGPSRALADGILHPLVYRAPELLCCVPDWCTKTDIWALGCLVIEMLNVPSRGNTLLFDPTRGGEALKFDDWDGIMQSQWIQLRHVYHNYPTPNPNDAELTSFKGFLTRAVVRNRYVKSIELQVGTSAATNCNSSATRGVKRKRDYPMRVFRDDVLRCMLRMDPKDRKSAKDTYSHLSGLQLQPKLLDRVSICDRIYRSGSEYKEVDGDSRWKRMTAEYNKHRSDGTSRL